VTKTAANRLLSGGAVGEADLISNGPGSLRAINEFVERHQQLNAGGVVFVDYHREAFVSKSAEAARVTFDRHVVARGYVPGCGLAPSDDASPAVAKGVVLELKYNGRAPRWMHDLVTTFSLGRLSFPKYVYCVDALRIGPRLTGPLAGSAQR
jgi:hypothetical protein